MPEAVIVPVRLRSKRHKGQKQGPERRGTRKQLSYSIAVDVVWIPKQADDDHNENGGGGDSQDEVCHMFACGTCERIQLQHAE